MLENLLYGVLAVGYIDDICLLTWGFTVQENYSRLRHAHERAEQWEKTHASQFSPAKYGLIYLVSRP
jgi:uncharacterized membrane protein YkvA (DUF1232 family)